MTEVNGGERRLWSSDSGEDTPLGVRSVSIFILEDDPLLGMFMRDYLECFGLDAEIAKTVARGRELLQTRTYTLAFCDVNLPDGSGVTLHEMARGMGIESYVMSTNPRPADVEAEVFLYKPELYRSLMAVCSRHIRMRRDSLQDCAT